MLILVFIWGKINLCAKAKRRQRRHAGIKKPNRKDVLVLRLADSATVMGLGDQLMRALVLAAVLAVAAREREIETLGLDFGLVNARLLVRRTRAAGVPTTRTWASAASSSRAASASASPSRA